VKNMEEAALKKSGRKLPTSNTCTTPTNITYSPKMDITEELNENDVTYFQGFIGVLQATDLLEKSLFMKSKTCIIGSKFIFTTSYGN
jgi:hypothetical protein